VHSLCVCVISSIHSTIIRSSCDQRAVLQARACVSVCVDCMCSVSVIKSLTVKLCMNADIILNESIVYYMVMYVCMYTQGALDSDIVDLVQSGWLYKWRDR
jgi:hypothetical protein